ncbi:guanylate cyclase soluble subunit beta-2 [Holotrichia oblita]|uniref:Guanylate cyclase soluble subunit beta-2 n=1 Tax=Holotrichia oblita TaxID=644536 RepID=A0ACB9TAW4_HOLOL|nr:guanylate cyclase soluble subunit beta-2 [Holotrichia oblita]
MVRTYERTPGARTYRDYSDEIMREAIETVKAGMSKKLTAETFGVERTTLGRRIVGTHLGRPSVLTAQEEALIARTLGVVANWRFPLTKVDIRNVIEKFLDKQGKTVRIFKNNCPRPNFLDSSIKRNNLNVRMASNIKRSRSSVDHNDILDFFDNIDLSIKEVKSTNFYNYDETNVTDDPGSRKVVVPRNTKDLEIPTLTEYAMALARNALQRVAPVGLPIGSALGGAGPRQTTAPCRHSAAKKDHQIARKDAEVQMEGMFLVRQIYEDEITYNLISSAVDILQIPATAILELFGNAFFEFCQDSGYDKILQVLGATPRDFLQNLDALHDHLGTLYPGMKAPSFRCTERPEDGALVLHYYSDRPGLEYIVIGIVKAVASKLHGTEVDVQILKTKNDVDHIQFLITEKSAPEKQQLPEIAEIETLSLGEGLFISDIPIHDATRDLVLMSEQFEADYKLARFRNINGQAATNLSGIG